MKFKLNNFVRALPYHFLTKYKNQKNKIFGLFLLVFTINFSVGAQQNRTIAGTVKDKLGKAIQSVNVKIDGQNSFAQTDVNGNFQINTTALRGVIVFTAVGFQSRSVPIENAAVPLTIVLDDFSNGLDEVQIIGYGTTTKRLNTGSSSGISASQIEKQPVANPLASLQGRVAGLVITQDSGVAGSGFKVRIRGQNSLLQGAEPLYIIDGIPFAPDNQPLNQLSSAAGLASSDNGMSHLNLLNPSDIETIDVLKDADATAIYGSRGANGVILITTKKPKGGPVSVSFNSYFGVGKITRSVDFLNTQQYIEMRKEALSNSNLTPTVANAGDLLLWDNNRYTDFKKLLIGGTAKTSDVQFSMSGGSAQTGFVLATGYHKETTVFPTELGDRKISFRAAFNHQSTDKKFRVGWTTSYLDDENKLPISDLSRYINTNPMFKLYDEQGNLNWEEGGQSYYSIPLINANPLVFQHQRYVGKYSNLNSSLTLDYNFLKNIFFKANLGYNQVIGAENSQFPLASIDPNSGQLPSSYFANRKQQSLIAEPQLSYRNQFNLHGLDVMVGGTWQSKKQESNMIYGYDYINDLFLNNVSAAGTSVLSNNENLYRYQGIYGRINYNFGGKYLLNLSGRRDGSSRFGPNNRFSNFGAIGAAWIFSEEKFLKRFAHVLSFGKLRGSYGITGNDQIGNYKYLDTWTTNSANYNGTLALNPSSLYNPSYLWEYNRKTEVAVELGFFKNAILFSTAYYLNRSKNQLVNYTLPNQTGFGSVIQNLDALIENSGWEFELTTQNLNGRDLTWSTTFNISAPKNKLVDFPGLATSSYAGTYNIGHSLSTKYVYQYLGVNPQTGIYSINDLNGDGRYTLADRVFFINTDPKFYGGLGNVLNYKGFEFQVFVEFKKQIGINYLQNLSTQVPGFGYSNQPSFVLDRWQKAGDIAPVQRFTGAVDEAYTMSYSNMKNSDAIYSDASYIRIKNASLHYSLPASLLQKVKVKRMRVFVQGQNLLTITHYKGSDPENQDLLTLPPLQVFTAGFQLTL